MNLLTLLPSNKYSSEAEGDWGSLYSLGMDKVMADLYFTLPFDLGIVETCQTFDSGDDPLQGEVEEYGKVFIGEPYQVDCEVSKTLGIKIGYLDLIRVAKVGFGN